MKAKKTVLIITDDSLQTAKMAASIKTALKGNKVLVKTATEFQGSDILPAEVFFLGCEKPNTESFAYIEDLLRHINLAGRPCGVFSPGSAKAAKYLAGLVKDCEAALNPEHLTGAGVSAARWAKKVVSGKF